MPTTINGIGTHYYGQSDRSSRNAPCHSCQRYGTLESYTTRLWFVVVFLPVIPLGRKRIIDSCPSCRRHMVASAAKYEQARQLQTSGSLERFRREGTPEAALDAHAQLLAFHEYDPAEVLRNQALDLFPDDAPLRVGLANHLRQAAFYDEMARLNQQAHALDPDLPLARAGVAVWSMMQGLLDEARQLLDFMEEPGAGRECDLGPLYTLAGKLAEADRHEEALELYAVLLREAPHLGQRADFRDLVRKSERAHRSGELLLPGRRHSLRGLFFAGGSPYTAGQRKFAIVSLALILSAVGLGASNEFIRRNRVIHVVNAGDPVQIQVNDGPVQTIAGLGSIPVGEGRHRIRVSGPVQETHDVEVAAAGYFERWTRSPAWILNPGLEAVIEQMTVYYAVNPPPPEEMAIVGRPFLTLSHVDYLFTEPPGSMKVKRNNERVIKEVVRWVQGQDRFAFGELVGGNRPAALDFAEKRLRRNPDDKGLLEAYAVQTHSIDRERADAFFQAGLDRKPVSIPWHRIAQSFATAPERNRMIAGYDTTLQAEPNNAALLYLRGRMEPDSDRRGEFDRRSIAADPKFAMPVMALASRAMVRGEWAEALAGAKRAETLQVQDGFNLQIIHTARLALGQAREMVEEYRTRLKSDPVDLTTLGFLTEALVESGQADSVEYARGACEDRLPPAVRGAIAPTVRALSAYVAGRPQDFDRFVKPNLPAIEPDLRVHCLLATGPAGAVLGDPDLPKIEPWTAGAIALGLALEGRIDDAKIWKDKCASMIADRLDEDQQVVAHLKANSPPAVEEIRRCLLRPADKSILLALLAQEFPERRTDYRLEAARFNVRKSPPYLLIRRAIEAEAPSKP